MFSCRVISCLDFLHDRIVWGILNLRTQRRLLAAADLTLKAFEVAQAIESADTPIQELQYPSKAEMHAIGPQFGPSRAQVPQGTLVNDHPPTPTLRDSVVVRPPRTPLTTRPPCTPSQRTAWQRYATTGTKDPMQDREVAGCIGLRTAGSGK